MTFHRSLATAFLAFFAIGVAAKGRSSVSALDALLVALAVCILAWGGSR